MSARGTSRPKDLDEAKQRVTDLEDEAREMIAKNQKYVFLMATMHMILAKKIFIAEYRKLGFPYVYQWVN